MYHTFTCKNYYGQTPSHSRDYYEESYYIGAENLLTDREV